MDKIHLSLTSSEDLDFSRLFAYADGFHGDVARIAFSATDSVSFFIMAETKYSLTIEGDAEFLKDSDFGMRPSEFFHDFGWSAAAQQAGFGSATLKLVHPDHPDEPSVYHLTMGEFNFEHSAPKRNSVTLIKTGGTGRLHITGASHDSIAEIPGLEAELEGHRLAS